jgi:xanthine dehydrogenase accessory factor
MTRLGLPEALRLGLDRQRSGGAALLHVVELRSESFIDRDARMVVTGSDEVIGSLNASIDRATAEAGRQALGARKSRVYSISPTEDGGTIAGIRGGEVDVFAEVLPPTPSLLIVGAGHIAQPLSVAAGLMDFSVTVIDDRPEFANESRFPGVDRIVVDDFALALSRVTVTADTYAVLVTRGHVHDRHALEHMLKTPARYIGVIGSKTRIRTLMRSLRQEGFVSENLERIYAPIGLDLAAETPSEIAIAIAAEIVDVRRGGRSKHMALESRLRV